MALRTLAELAPLAVVLLLAWLLPLRPGFWALPTRTLRWLAHARWRVLEQRAND